MAIGFGKKSLSKGKISIEKLLGYNRQKKALASTLTYDNQLLSLRGEAERDPWKDAYDTVCFRFHNKISLTMRNEGKMPIDTDVSDQPIAFNLDIRGKLEDFRSVPGVKLLDVKPANPKLELSTKDGQVKLNHVHLEPGESFQIVFSGYFTVGLEKLMNNKPHGTERSNIQ
jgi:hypothetical protein